MFVVHQNNSRIDIVERQSGKIDNPWPDRQSAGPVQA